MPTVFRASWMQQNGECNDAIIFDRSTCSDWFIFSEPSGIPAFNPRGNNCWWCLRTETPIVAHAKCLLGISIVAHLLFLLSVSQVVCLSWWWVLLQFGPGWGPSESIWCWEVLAVSSPKSVPPAWSACSIQGRRRETIVSKLTILMLH